MALVPSKFMLFSFPTSYLFDSFGHTFGLIDWKGSSWQLGFVFSNVCNISLTLIISIETCKEV